MPLPRYAEREQGAWRESLAAATPLLPPLFTSFCFDTCRRLHDATRRGFAPRKMLLPLTRRLLLITVACHTYSAADTPAFHAAAAS